jgi:hypothetical protein
MSLNSPWYLGLNPGFVGGGPSSYHLDGNLDEVGIYVGAALSASEVLAIYSAGLTDLRAGPQSLMLHNYYRMGDLSTDSAAVMTDVMGNIDMTGSGEPTIEADVPLVTPVYNFLANDSITVSNIPDGGAIGVWLQVVVPAGEGTILNSWGVRLNYE